MKRTGYMESPLHPGRCPSWLFRRMKKLGGLIGEAIIEEHGEQELLKRIADPLFFQALGCVLGFDWHSSGLTTTVCGALSEGFKEQGLSVRVLGGKGLRSRKTPEQIKKLSTEWDLDPLPLEKASRMSAKVDNSLVQDGHQLYHHSFFLAETGNWAVVQQGMNQELRTARRYHWLGKKVDSFVVEPQTGVVGKPEENVLDLTARKGEENRRACIDLVKEADWNLTNIKMPSRHEILPSDLTEADKKFFEKVRKLEPSDYEELVAVRGMGPKKLRSLALIAGLVYGEKPEWKDPVKFSFAHGGKDRIPYPVNRKMYDENILFLEETLDKVKGHEKKKALKKLAENSFITKESKLS